MVTLMAPAKVEYNDLLLSIAFEAFHEGAKPTFPSLSGLSLLPRHHTPLLSHLPAFVHAAPTAQPTFPSHAPLPSSSAPRPSLAPPPRRETSRANASAQSSTGAAPRRSPGSAGQRGGGWAGGASQATPQHPLTTAGPAESRGLCKTLEPDCVGHSGEMDTGACFPNRL